MNTYPRVYLTYHGDGNVGIGTPPDASAPLVMGEPVERVRVRMSNQEPAAHVFAATERNKLAAWMMSQGYATGHGDSVEDLLHELEWQIREQEREACAAMAEAFHHHQYDFTGNLELHEAIRARGEK
jgi:hypothetical protein